MKLLSAKGVVFRTDGLSREGLRYLESKLRRIRRRRKDARNLFLRILNLLLPRDYLRVDVETWVQGRTLVVGCGGGIEAIGLGAVGIDIDRAALRIAVELSAHAEGASASFVAASGSELPFRAACFDSVLSDNVVEHFPPADLPRHFREVVRVLRPGGRYVFTTPNRLFEVPPKEGHVALHSYAEWERLVREAGFRDVRTPRRRSGELGDVEWKIDAERRAAARGLRLGLSHRGLRMVTLVAFR
jgi:SAM-dependent methyltransferase